MHRISGLLVFTLSLGTAVAGPMPESTPPTTFNGKVTPAADLPKQAGVKVDKDGVAIVTAGGTAYTVVEDVATRVLLWGDDLHGREVRLTAKELPGSRVLKVSKVQTVKNGKVFDVDYWCEHCQLSATEPGPCKCCGGPTVLRELPAK